MQDDELENTAGGSDATRDLTREDQPTESEADRLDGDSAGLDGDAGSAGNGSAQPVHGTGINWRVHVDVDQPVQTVDD